MRSSPMFMSALYFLLGCVFTYLAITSIETTMWNFYTILLILMATFDFSLSLRLLLLRLQANGSKRS